MKTHALIKSSELLLPTDYESLLSITSNSSVAMIACKVIAALVSYMYLKLFEHPPLILLMVPVWGESVAIATNPFSGAVGGLFAAVIPANTNKHTHTYTHIHTYAHMHTHTHTHTQTHNKCQNQKIITIKMQLSPETMVNIGFSWRPRVTRVFIPIIISCFPTSEPICVAQCA